VWADPDGERVEKQKRLHPNSHEDAKVIIIGGTFEVEPDQREEFLAGRL
jgi:hypothetical protein